MNTRGTYGIGTVLALLVLVFAPAALAQGPGAPDDGPGGRGWWNNPRVIERLDLTPEQRKQIDARIFTSGQRMIDLRADAERAQLQLSRLLAADDLDDGAVDRAVEQVTGAHCAMERERNELRVDIARVLNRDQRLALARFLDEKRPLRPRRR